MQIRPSTRTWGYHASPGYFSLRVDEDDLEIAFQYSAYEGENFCVSVLFPEIGDIFEAPATPLAALSRVLAQRPGLLDRDDVRALRDYLLAQPGALRAGS